MAASVAAPYPAGGRFADKPTGAGGGYSSTGRLYDADAYWGGWYGWYRGAADVVGGKSGTCGGSGGL